MLLPPLPEIDALALRNDRLDLIPITRTHAPAMFQVLKDPALYEYQTGSPPADVALLTRRYEFWEGRRSPDGSELWLNWALRLQGQEELIGHLQAGVLRDHADVAAPGVRYRGSKSSRGLARAQRRSRNPRFDQSGARGQHRSC